MPEYNINFTYNTKDVIKNCKIIILYFIEYDIKIVNYCYESNSQLISKKNLNFCIKKDEAQRALHVYLLRKQSILYNNCKGTGIAE